MDKLSNKLEIAMKAGTQGTEASRHNRRHYPELMTRIDRLAAFSRSSDATIIAALHERGE